MKTWNRHGWALPMLALALVALPVLAEDGAKASAEASPEAAMMEAMHKAGAPGENHAFLAGMEGDWTYTSQVWMDPSQPPMETKGTSKKTMIFGGRYLQEETTGEMMGQAFEGRAVTGYDNTAEEYVGTWIDDMTTGIAVARGQRDGKTITMHGEYLDPMTKQNMKVRQVLRKVDDDHHVFEYYMTMPGAPEVKSMEIRYARE